MLQIQKASAGSGKTFTLAREYIKMLLGYRSADGRFVLRSPGSFGARKNKPHGNILAVTFTNKATEEMTSRIVRELAVLAYPGGGNRSSYLDDYMKAFSATEEEISLSAEAALKDLLYNFAQFNVMTIDSFFQNVLRTFARELELPDNPSLEIDEEFPITSAVNDMLGGIKAGPRNLERETEEERRNRLFLEKWLTEFMTAQLDEGSQMNLFSRGSRLTKELISTVKGLMGETYKLNRKKIDYYLSDPQKLIEFQGYVIKEHKSLREKFVLSAKRLLEMVGDVGNLSKNVRGAVVDAASGLEPKKLNDTFILSGEDEKKRYLAAFIKKGGNTPELNAAYDEFYLDMTTYKDKGTAYKSISNRLYIFGLFGAVVRALENYRHETDTFLLSDTNDLLRRIISEDEAPFIYERLGSRIRHYLIDEFQDTSQMQWENFRPLLLESLSQENDNLIIGDEKQSIYRFRNSNPDLLRCGVEADIEPRFGSEAIELRGTDIEENCNWRSTREVVMFNNALFLAIAALADEKSGTKDISEIYSNLIQRIPDKHSDFNGYVKAIFAPPARKGNDAPEDDEEAAATVSTEEKMLSRLVAEVSRQLSSGYSPGDIAVLVRRRYQGEKVIRALMNAMNREDWPHGKIPILSFDALRVEASHSVQMIINFLRLATTPELVVDTEASERLGGKKMKSNPEFRRFRLIHRYELCLMETVADTDMETGEPLFDEDGSPLMRHLTATEALRKAIIATSGAPGSDELDDVQKSIDEQTERVRNMGCPTLLGITETIIDRFLTEEAKRNDNTFLTSFQDLVSDFSEFGESDIRSFLEWWDSKGHNATLSAPDGLQAITVTTIHQSKGLEYPCVHVPYCNKNWEMVKDKGQSWLPLDKADFVGCDSGSVPPMIPLDYKKAASLKNNSLFRKTLTAFANTQRIDNINTAYVAFTRAVNELVIYSQIFLPRKNGAESTAESLGRYVHKVLCEGYRSTELPEENKLRWLADLGPSNLTEDAEEEGGIVFELGKPTEKNHTVSEEHESGSEGERERLTSYYVVDHPDTHLAVVLDTDKLTGFDFNDERSLGTFLHQVMSGIRTADDLPLAVRRNAYRFGVSADDEKRVLDFLQGVVATPQALPWFSGYERLLTERPLTAPSSIRRPDRVVWLPGDEIHVIDYKFGKHDSPKYHEQVRDYMGLIGAAYPDCNVRGFLWFPHASKIVEVN